MSIAVKLWHTGAFPNLHSHSVNVRSAATIVAVQKQEEGDGGRGGASYRSYDELLDEIFIYIARLKTRVYQVLRRTKKKRVTRSQRAK